MTKITYPYSKGQVKLTASEMKIELTDKECMEVLSFMKLKLDTTLGVSWDTIEWAIKECFKEKLEEK